MTRHGPRPLQNPGAAGRFDAIAREAQRLINTQHYIEAVLLCNEAVQRGGKRDPNLLAALAMAQMCLFQLTESKATLEKALALDPRSLDLRRRMTLLLVTATRFDEAEAHARRTLRDHPHDSGTIRLLAESLTPRGREAEAIALLEEALARTPQDLHLNFALMQIAGRKRDRQRVMERSARLLENPATPSDMITAAWFARGAVLDALGEHDSAFEAFERGNAASGKAFSFDAAAHSREVDTLLSIWTPEALATLPKTSRRSDRVVLIVGMPRSGTSLVEQIIASHPRAYGAGELHTLNQIAVVLQKRTTPGRALMLDLRPLTPGAVDDAAARYQREALGPAPGADRVTDKMPTNFFHLGLASLILPQARIIHCRRDARDTCLSCYFSDFLGWRHAYSSDLASLGSFYADYWRVMQHWKRVLPVPILDVQYETLTTDQEAQTRRLIEFVGLPWDDRCLRFHETRREVRTLSAQQVKRPMYRSSVARWRPYEKRLGPLLERLPTEACVDDAPDGSAG